MIQDYEKLRTFAIIVGYIVVALSFTIGGFIFGLAQAQLDARTFENIANSTYEIIINETAEEGEFDTTINTYSMYLEQDEETFDLTIEAKENAYLDD